MLKWSYAPGWLAAFPGAETMTFQPIYSELREGWAGAKEKADVATVHDLVTQSFEEARDDVFRYLITLGLYPPQAQEATQEVFLRLYLELKKGEQIQNIRAWVFRVAHNLGLQIREKEDSLRPFDPGLEETLRDAAQTPEFGLLERERMLRLHSAVETLSPQQRHCLQLRAEGLRYHEIAETIGIGVSTVSEFLRRAIERLRKAAHD